ncbi:MAG: helix-turn-helix domain-containing protein [Planctomycetes bacterium]|nr:helix-turn-helix domain-containing protein [Planctomycetota bacterium]
MDNADFLMAVQRESAPKKMTPRPFFGCLFFLGVSMNISIADELAQAASSLPPLPTKSQAATFANVSPHTISRWIKSGRLKAAKSHPGKHGRVLVVKSSLLALLAGAEA